MSVLFYVHALQLLLVFNWFSFFSLYTKILWKKEACGIFMTIRLTYDCVYLSQSLFSSSYEWSYLSTHIRPANIQCQLLILNMQKKNYSHFFFLPKKKSFQKKIKINIRLRVEHIMHTLWAAPCSQNDSAYKWNMLLCRTWNV